MSDDRSEFVGTAEAAQILGVEVPRITRWRERMPNTADEIAATPVWWREDIEAMAQGKTPPKRRKVKLAGVAEAAKILGVDKSQIGRWRRAGKFTEPHAELVAGPVWHQKNITAFKRRRATEQLRAEVQRETAEMKRRADKLHASRAKGRRKAKAKS